MADFRDKLAQRNAASGSSKGMKVINMQSKANYGSIVFVPITGSDGSDAIALLGKVMEVKEKYTYEKDGKVESGERWLKVLQKDDYPPSEMNAEKVAYLKNTRSKIKYMNDFSYHKDRKKSDDLRKGIVRIKNYTLLMGYCIEHTGLDGKIVNQNCPAILVFSSSRFDDAFEKALKGKDKNTGGSEWQSKLFNRDELRKMFLSIEYKLSDSKKIIGYITSLQIEKFDDDTTKYTNGREDGLHMEDKKEAIEACTNAIRIFTGTKSEDYLNENSMQKLDAVIEKWMLKYQPNMSITGSDESDSDKE